MRAWGLVAVAGILLATATPAVAASDLAIRRDHRSGAAVVFERAGLAQPIGLGPAPSGLRLTTAVGGPPSRERLEGRLETRTKLASPQVGCWRGLARGFFLGLELGWSVASSAPARAEAPGARDGGGFAALARPTTSLLHFGWSR